MKFQPVIKWSGSKRSQSEEIIKRFSSQIKIYYEPFVGGGSVLRQLLESDIKVEKYIASDLNKDLINLWNEIKNNPTNVFESYKKMWEEMNINEDREFKKQYFYKIRNRYNISRSPTDFMFVMRTTTNGMPRYNKKGDFNNSFHITRDGIKPKNFENIIYEWSDILNLNNVTFIHQSYESVISNKQDLIYLDPPYANTKGMYYGNLDYSMFWEWLKSQKGNYVLSFDGKSGDIDSTYKVPLEIYNKHEYLLNGNSSFKRTMGNSSDSIVYESLYIK